MPLSAAPLRNWSPTTQKFRALGQLKILADSADETIVLSFDEDRHRVAVLRGIVEQPKSREMRESLARVGLSDLRLGLGVDGNRMGGEDRHPHGGRGNQQFGQVENFPDLVDQLYFLVGVAALDKFAGRDQVECNLMRENIST